MITIYGKYTNAVVYTTENEQYAMDEYARKQLQMICDHPSAAGSKIRVMPDVHPGKVGTIGLVPYAEPGSQELFGYFREAVSKSDGFILKQHGPVIGGRSLMDAFYGLEELEESCRVAWTLDEGRRERVDSL